MLSISNSACRRRRTIFTPGSSIRSAVTDLKRAIEILVGNKRKFDTTTNHDLFATYVAPHTSGETDLNGVSQRLHPVMASTKQFLTVAIADNRSQIQAMNEVADQAKSGLIKAAGRKSAERAGQNRHACNQAGGGPSVDARAGRDPRLAE
jgi:hypothetical protein